MNTRTRILGGLVLLLVVVFAFDKLVLDRAADDDADLAISPRARYQDAAGRLAEKQAIIDSRGDLEGLLAAADARWNDAARRMIRASTGELAASQLRDRVRSLAEEFGAMDFSASAAQTEPIENAPGVEILELDVSFRLRSSIDAFTLIDRMENMPDLDTAISRIRLSGPGRLPQTKHQNLTVSLTLRALASVGQEA